MSIPSESNLDITRENTPPPIDRWDYYASKGRSYEDIVRGFYEMRKKGIIYSPAKKVRIADTIRLAVFVRDRYRCLICGSRVNLQVDHIIPECKGGADDMDKLQTLCRSCNCRKGGR